MLTPEPFSSAHDSAFWAGLVANQLLLQRCRSTGILQYWPRAHSLATGRGGEMDWVESPGLGTLHTFSVVRRSFYDNLEAPYILAVVDLDENVRLLGHFVGATEKEVFIGQRLVFSATKTIELKRIAFERS